jgi:hypothetical protein
MHDEGVEWILQAGHCVDFHSIPHLLVFGLGAGEAYVNKGDNFLDE